jgi:ribonuclease VapC
VNVFDASALLAYLRGEVGTEVVREHLAEGGVCGAANWAEVAQKVRGTVGEWDLARALLLSYDLVVEPVTRSDAEDAALMWRPGRRDRGGDQDEDCAEVGPPENRRGLRQASRSCGAPAQTGRHPRWSCVDSVDGVCRGVGTREQTREVILMARGCQMVGFGAVDGFGIRARSTRR